MPGPTTERLDEDYRSLREDMHDIKVILARLDARLDAFDEDVRANTTGLTALDVRMGSLDARAGALDARLGIVDARLAWLVGAGKWLGSIFALAALYGILNIFGRLVVVENQLKNVEAQMSEIRGALSRRQPETSAELDERINRIARVVVDEAIKRATLSKPTP